MNRRFRRPDVDPLPPNMVAYADGVIRGLHAALHMQAEPVFRRPEQPVDGWGLTATPLIRQGEMMGTPVSTILGSRAIYLATKPTVMYRVLSVPYPREPFEEQVIQVRRTSVPALLVEDPTLYYGLLNSADDYVERFGLDYQIPQAPAPTEPT
jgi:hypothetical protein